MIFTHETFIKEKNLSNVLDNDGDYIIGVEIQELLNGSRFKVMECIKATGKAP